MAEQMQFMKQIQSEIIQSFIVQAEQLHTLHDYLKLIEKSCVQHLNIDKSCFLVAEGDKLVSIGKGYIEEVASYPVSLTMVDSHFYNEDCVALPYYFSEQENFKQYNAMIRLQANQQTRGLFVFRYKGASFEQLNGLSAALSTLFNYASTIAMMKQMGDQYRKLYNVSDLFHSTMDMERIIENVLATVQMNFPSFQLDLILSNDQDRHSTIDVKIFDYLYERPATIEAFVSGDVTTEYAIDLDARLLNVPIKGRQAIYGILQISAPAAYVFSSMEKDFMRMLCTASGNALENAKLYHQSHRLISDLQLINETTHHLNMRLSIHEMLDYLKKQLMKSFQPMEVCFVLEGKTSIKECTSFFETEQGEFYYAHVKKHFQQSDDALFVADFSRINVAPVLFNSMMAIPIMIEERVSGYAIVLHKESYFFSFDSYKLMQSLIHHSSLAISNSILRNKLQEMVDRDHLTNLYARSYLDKCVATSVSEDISGMLLLMDIDNFKSVNDTYGHQVGDEVLVQIANYLNEQLSEQAVCARWGGEELAIYMANVSEKDAGALAEQIVYAIPTVTTPAVTISAGVHLWTSEQAPTTQTIFLYADQALYAAKHNGKNQFCLFPSSQLHSL